MMLMSDILEAGGRPVRGEQAKAEQKADQLDLSQKSWPELTRGGSATSDHCGPAKTRTADGDLKPERQREIGSV